MSPSEANHASVNAGWRLPAFRVARPTVHLPGPARLGVKGRLAVLAVAVMAMSLALVAVWNELVAGSAPAPSAPVAGTAFLGTASCADWRDAGVERRMVIVRTLAVAATRPNPENPGATLANGAAYGLLQRVCATAATDSTLLYESYNRAASFQSVRAGSPAGSRSFGSR